MCNIKLSSKLFSFSSSTVKNLSEVIASYKFTIRAYGQPPGSNNSVHTLAFAGLFYYEYTYN